MTQPHLIWRLWGKVGAQKAGCPWHPLVCHMLDVAAVADALWERVMPAAMRERFRNAFGCDEAASRRMVAFFTALHDLGKASPAFQAKWEERKGALAQAGLRFPLASRNPKHGLVTAWALTDLLRDAGMERCSALSLAVAVGGHHGLFVHRDLPTDDHGGSAWSDLRREIFATLRDVIGAQTLPALAKTPHDSFFMILAGLTTTADWIGSANEFFPYDPVAADAGTYWTKARRLGASAIERLGWLTGSVAQDSRTFEQLFPAIAEPNDTQRRVVELSSRMPDEPALAIVEAPTGEGKTEAAMYLADRWQARQKQRGVYFALPTQATSNQMFERVVRFLRGRAPASLAHVLLLHGHAALSAEFQVLKDNAYKIFSAACVQNDDRGAAGHVVAAEWFGYRKRGLLAPYGIGTVDQALLAVLQSKHCFVRLFGLAHKTVIVDEVHAYDTYMSTLLERLLEWLRALGCSVVLLSATLPRARRDALTRAFSPASASPPAQYPRITYVAGARAESVTVEVSTRARRSVALKMVTGRDYAADLAELLSEGGCAAIICNTVARAQEVYLSLRKQFAGDGDDGMPVLDLFHARYLFEERDRRERRALGRFGKEGRRPHKAILVATQVVEQSLDLDFDLMISDLAPVDLVLQRMGRLHRHHRANRPSLLGQPQLWLIMPSAGAAGPIFERADTSVYDEHVLLRSWLSLVPLSALRVPDDVERLIEFVYGDTNVPAELECAVQERLRTTLERQIRDIETEEREASNRRIGRPGRCSDLVNLLSDPREEDAPE